MAPQPEGRGRARGGVQVTGPLDTNNSELETRTAASTPEANRALAPRRRDAAFAAIAASYHWRPAYPPSLFTTLNEHYGLDGRQCVLDLGCGTGRIAIGLARCVDEVVALDTVPQMLARGARDAEQVGLGHRIRWVQAAAEDLPSLGLGPFDVAVAGSSMHWMDRARVLADLDAVIAPGGGVAVISGFRPAGYLRPVWQEAADEVRMRWLGPDPAPRHQRGEQRASDEAVLTASAFSAVTRRTWDQRIVRDIEGVVGLQYSYAFSSPALLGGDQPAFETDLRRALAACCPSGVFEDLHRTEALIATRP
jgi:ubiquinone/menaquinone biosynthesis C-methylase UbiE